MKVSVITPNFNGLKFLKNYFDSLENEKHFVGEIIIIDNGSNDGSLEFIKNYSKNSDFKIKLVENPNNLGFSKAINQGILISNYPYLFLLNNDTEVKKGCISKLINCLNSEDNIFSVSSKMIQYNHRNLIDDAGDEYTLLSWTKKAGNNQNINKYSKNREIFSSCAGGAIYKKEIFGKIGLFDENFFAYLEDVDIGFRAQIHGFKNCFSSEAIVYHIGSGTSGSKYNEFKVKISARNNIWLIYKNLPIPLKILNIGFIFIGMFIKYIFFVKKGFGKSYIDGIKEGIVKREKINKIIFNRKNTKNYFKIEYKLILNTFNLLRK